MSLLLYAVASAPAAIAGTGVGSARLEPIESDGLVAIVSPLPTETCEVNEKSLWEYEQALERLMAQHVILPARFGSVLSDAAEVRETLSNRQAGLTHALARVSGTVEYGITTCWHDRADAAEPDSGTAYMLGRLALHRRASALTRRLDPLAALARSSRLRVLPRPSLPVTGCYLVDVNRTEQFVELVAQLDTLLHEVDVVCTGPWPPYSFVEAMPA